MALGHGTGASVSDFLPAGVAAALTAAAKYKTFDKLPESLQETLLNYGIKDDKTLIAATGVLSYGATAAARDALKAINKPKKTTSKHKNSHRR